MSAVSRAGGSRFLYTSMSSKFRLDYHANRYRRIWICQNASHRFVVQISEFVFCFHNSPRRRAMKSERFGLSVQGGVTRSDQGFVDQLNWDFSTFIIWLHPKPVPATCEQFLFVHWLASKVCDVPANNRSYCEQLRLCWASLKGACYVA